MVVVFEFYGRTWKLRCVYTSGPSSPVSSSVKYFESRTQQGIERRENRESNKTPPEILEL